MDKSNSVTDEDTSRGRDAARQLWKKGLKRSQVIDPLTHDFAHGALSELELLQQNTAGVIKEVLEGAEMSAEQLNVESFHGLVEVVQNADDLRATGVRVAIRKTGRKSVLLIAHDGERVQIEHVLAMTLAFVSTKRDDPRAKGRFGIGLKTLGRLGNRLSVHCPPYHFVIEKNSVQNSKPHKPIAGFYDSSSTDTLLELELRSEFEFEEFRNWFSALGSQSLLFLDSVQSLQLFDLRNRKPIVHHRLNILKSKKIELPSVVEQCTYTELKEPRSTRRWFR